MQNKLLIQTLLTGLTLSGAAQAALIDRGGGLIYDDVLNITWLQDANYAKTSGYDADGRMIWADANTWAANLTFHDSVRNVDYTDWRLAANTPVGSEWNYSYTIDGSSDLSYNITSPHSELSYMYHVNLGLKSKFSPSGVFQADYGVFGNGTTGGQADIGLIRNLQSSTYWSGTAYAADPSVVAWAFGTTIGFQLDSMQINAQYVWAVRPGDVAAVPEAETYVMLLAGLGLVGVAVRRRKQTVA